MPLAGGKCGLAYGAVWRAGRFWRSANLVAGAVNALGALGGVFAARIGVHCWFSGSVCAVGACGPVQSRRVAQWQPAVRQVSGPHRCGGPGRPVPTGGVWVIGRLESGVEGAVVVGSLGKQWCGVSVSRAYVSLQVRKHDERDTDTDEPGREIRVSP